MAEALDKQALEYLVGIGKKLSPVETVDFDGRKYTRQELNPVHVPVVTPLTVSTLGSVEQLCVANYHVTETEERGFEGFDPDSHVVSVVDETEVHVLSAISNKWKARDTLIKCKMTETIPFLFGKFMSQEAFIISMLSCFVKESDRDDLAKLAGNATAEHVSTAEDDGVTQLVATRSGAHLNGTETAKNLVTLRPYRTFREVEQPASDFLFRVQQSGDNMPTFALFPADGGAWKFEALENIARHLRVGLPAGSIVVY